MTLEELISPYHDSSALLGSESVELSDITDDSREVTPGCVFIARHGLTCDGRGFISDAIRQGASAILTDIRPPEDLPIAGCGPVIGKVSGRPGSNPQGVGWVVFERLDHGMTGELAERFFGYPSREIRLAGVTGTNGKTTVTFLIKHLIESTGEKCGLISTVLTDDGSTRRPADLTTPGPIAFSRLLAGMREHGCGFAVAEVSSHALHQGRTAAIRFDVGVFTNFTGDHLDYHRTMNRYADAKALLFAQLRPGGPGHDPVAVINGDDPYAERMARGCRAKVIYTHVHDSASGREALSKTGHPHGPRQGHGVIKDSVSPSAGDRSVATIIGMGVNQITARFRGSWGDVEACVPLVGRHNISNTLQAVVAADVMTRQKTDWRPAIESFPPVPGRLEAIRLDRPREADHHPTVIVDYAHTHDALENVLQTLRQTLHATSSTGHRHGEASTREDGRLTVVFGAGGDRDRTKRPKMAEVACRLADRIVITSDNPRTEDPEAIIRDILAGVPDGATGRVTVEPDRAAAIRDGIHSARSADIVLIAGKGHEDYQIIGTDRIAFDDRVEAATALKNRLELTARSSSDQR